MLRALQWGLVLAVVGMIVAVFMVLPTTAQLAAQASDGLPRIGSHSVGGTAGDPGIPIVGWSTTSGDLRVGHFVGLHSLQALPLLALGLTFLARRAPAAATIQRVSVQAALVNIAGLGALGLTVILTWQALRGQALLSPDATTISALSGLSLVVAVLVLIVWRGRGFGLRIVHRRVRPTAQIDPMSPLMPAPGHGHSTAETLTR